MYTLREEKRSFAHAEMSSLHPGMWLDISWHHSSSCSFLNVGFCSQALPLINPCNLYYWLVLLCFMNVSLQNLCAGTYSSKWWCWGGANGKWLGHEDSTLTNGVSILVKQLKGTLSCFHPFCHIRLQQRHHQEKKEYIRQWILGHLILGPPTSKTVTDKFYCNTFLSLNISL